MHRLLFLGLAVLLGAVTLAGRAASAQVLLDGDTCGQALGNHRQDAIDCQTGFRLDPAQRKKLETASFGVLSDLRCTARITASRSEVIGMARAGGTVHLPPQTVHCRLLAQGQPFDVKFNLAPMVRVDQGRAVDAELGVREISGIPEPAATAVAGILNSDPGLRKSLIQAANDILPALPKR